MTTELLETLEARWEALVMKRQEAMREAMGTVSPAQRVAAIQQLNESRYYEDRFDELEMKIRVLDPDNTYLSENQPY